MSTKAYLSIPPYLMIYDDNGVTCPGAKVWTYKAGSSTPKISYTSYDSGIAAANPVVADSAGRVALWLASDGLYKLVITDANDNAINTTDNVGIGGTAVNLVVNTVIGASDSLKALADAAALSVVALGYRTIGDGAGGTFRWLAGATGGDDGETVDGNVAYTTGRWKRIIEGDINPKWWGCYGNNSDDDKPYMDNALTYAASVSKALILTNGTYYLSTTVDFQSVPVIFDKGAAFSWTNFTPDMTAIVQPGDISRHFIVSDPYVPKFAQGTEASPYWFGGKCDGVTADDVAINQAILSVTDHGGKVNMSDGTWAIGYSIELASNVGIQGVGLVKQATGWSGSYMIGSDTVAAHNSYVKDLRVTGAVDYGAMGIVIIGNETAVEDCVVKNCGYEGIKVGDSNYASDQTNVSIKNNTVTACGDLTDVFEDHASIRISQGKNVTVEGNIISGSTGKGISIAPVQNGLSEVRVLDNVVDGASISVDLSTISVTDVTIDRNHVSTKNIVVSGAGKLYGQISIQDNVVETDSSGIALTVTTDVADNYVINNNTIQGAVKGIALTTITKPLACHGNVITGGTDSTGIWESGSTDASYGTNLFNGVEDWYAVAQPRYCTLGTGFRSQIDGDTTCDGTMGITGNLNVSGDTSVAGDLNITGSLLSASNIDYIVAQGTFDATSTYDSVVVNFAYKKYQSNSGDPSVELSWAGAADMTAALNSHPLTDSTGGYPVPATIRPTGPQFLSAIVFDNGVNKYSPAAFEMTTVGYLALAQTPSTTNTITLYPGTVRYTIN